jgi:hypothetical protein
MTGNKLYFLLMVVFFVLIFLYQYYTPKKFVWRPTFSKHDKQPFGSYVFDDVMSTSIPDYQVLNKTFYQLVEDNLDDTLYGDGEHPLPLEKRRAFLLTENEIRFTKVDMQALLNVLKQGNKVMLCLSSFPGILCDSLCFKQNQEQFLYSYTSIDRYARGGYRRDSLFLGVDSLHPEQIFAVYPQLHPATLDEGRWQDAHKDSVATSHLQCDSFEVLVRNKLNEAVVMRLYLGEGELFLVGTPLMFTNYGLLDGGNAAYAFRLLSYLQDLPVARVEAYGVAQTTSGSPLRYFLSQPPLRWALYVALCTLLLFMIFAARRRQRVIPVVRPPVNETLRFTQLIGNLYYQKKDFKDLLNKKYLYFCAETKRLNGIDLQSGEPDGELVLRLAEKTGQDPRDLKPAFRELKFLLREDSLVDEDSMVRCIDRINEWMRRLA